jgi:hypothetical protein
LILNGKRKENIKLQALQFNIGFKNKLTYED